MEYKVNLSKYLKFKNGKKRIDKSGKYPLYGGNGKYGTSNNYNTDNSIIIGRVGAYCGSIYLSESKCWVSDNAISAQLVNDEDDLYYFYYLLKMLNLNFYSVGTSQPLLTQNILKNLKVNIAGRKNQKIISDILLNYDKKIETNNKIIVNLEAQAQALFKYYFIDFEPFADDEFIDSDLGPIPEGWEVNNIGDLIDFDIGGGWGKENPDEKHTDPAFVIRGADLDGIKNGSFNKDNYRYHKANNYEKRKLEEGDIIFESSGGSPTQVLGRLLYINDKVLDAYNDNVICASFCKLIRIKDKVLGWYIFNILNYAYNNKALVKYEVQSTGLANFAFTIFKEDYNIIVPSRINLERFYRNTFSFMNYSANLSVQNRMLAQTRDALLPKLMAGEIDLDKLGGAYD